MEGDKVTNIAAALIYLNILPQRSNASLRQIPSSSLLIGIAAVQSDFVHT